MSFIINYKMLQSIGKFKSQSLPSQSKSYREMNGNRQSYQCLISIKFINLDNMHSRIQWRTNNQVHSSDVFYVYWNPTNYGYIWSRKRELMGAYTSENYVIIPSSFNSFWAISYILCIINKIYYTVATVECPLIIFEGPAINHQALLSDPCQKGQICHLKVVIKKEGFSNAHSRCVFLYFVQGILKFVFVFREEHCGEIRFSIPIFDCLKIKSLKDYWALICSSILSMKFILLQNFYDGLSNFHVEFFPIKRTIFSFNQNSPQPSINVSVTLMYLIESDDCLQNLLQRQRFEHIIK